MRGILAALAASTATSSRRIFGYDNIRRHLQRQKRDYTRRANGSIAQGNRHGGPHEHKREIGRRSRQTARRQANYMLNGGFTRRGNEAGIPA